ncbi:MAG: hypothetical protein Q8O55_07710, partial [Dehalococcoidales bacterium]|nr:hypothetical protein [Dehalococcoidales bacterium]
DAGEVSMKDGWTGISGLSLPVTAGEYYWLAYVPQNRVGIVYQSTGMPADSHLAYQYTYGPLPGTPGSGSVNDTPFVMRATVDVSTGASALPSVTTGVFGLSSGDSVDKSAWFNMQRFGNTAGTGTLNKLEVLISDSAPSGNIRLGVYADNNGVPGELLLDAGEVSMKDGWTGISGLSLPVTAGEYYWLAYLPEKRVGVVYQSTGMPDGSHNCYAYRYGPLPDTPQVKSVNNTPFVMRATVNVY